MLEALLAVVGLGVTLLSALAFRSSSSLSRFFELVPDKALVSRLSTASEELTHALDAQREVATSLPAALSAQVAAQVKAGLAPLSEQLGHLTQESHSTAGRLAESHDHFTRAVLALNDDGNLAEWVGSFREVVQPLHTLSSAVEAHYQTAGQVLAKTSEVVALWSDQHQSVQEAFGHFSALVERSAAAETTHLRDIEHRLMNRLEEVADTNATVSHSLSELQTASRHALATNEDLARSVDGTVRQVGELIDLGRQTQGQHHELIRAQEGLQRSFAAWQASIEQGLSSLSDHTEKLVRGATESVALLGQGIHAAAADQKQLLAGFHNQHATALASLAQRFEKLSTEQGELLGQQRKLLAEAGAKLHSLPARGYQVATLALLAVQVLLTGVLLASISR